MDDSTLSPIHAPDDQGDARIDAWLKAWFQQLLAEPVPLKFHDLIDRLERASGM